MSMPSLEQAPDPPLFPKFSTVFAQVDAGRKLALGFLVVMAGLGLLAMLPMTAIGLAALWTYVEGRGNWGLPFTAVFDTVVLLIFLLNLRNRGRSWRPALLVCGLLLLGLWPWVHFFIRVLRGPIPLHWIEWRYILLPSLMPLGAALLHLGSMLAIRRLPWLGNEARPQAGEKMPAAPEADR